MDHTVSDNKNKGVITKENTTVKPKTNMKRVKTLSLSRSHVKTQLPKIDIGSSRSVAKSQIELDANLSYVELFNKEINKNIQNICQSSSNERETPQSHSQKKDPFCSQTVQKDTHGKTSDIKVLEQPTMEKCLKNVYNLMAFEQIEKESQFLHSFLRKLNEDSNQIIRNYTVKNSLRSLSKSRMKSMSQIQNRNVVQTQKEILENKKIMQEMEKEIKKLEKKIQKVCHPQEGVVVKIEEIVKEIQGCSKGNKIMKQEIQRNGKMIVSREKDGANDKNVNFLEFLKEVQRIQMQIQVRMKKIEELKEENLKVQKQNLGILNKIGVVQEKFKKVQSIFKEHGLKSIDEQQSKENQAIYIKKKAILEAQKKKSDFSKQKYQSKYFKLLKQLQSSTENIQMIKFEVGKLLLDCQTSSHKIIQLKNELNGTQESLNENKNKRSLSERTLRTQEKSSQKIMTPKIKKQTVLNKSTIELPQSSQQQQIEQKQYQQFIQKQITKKINKSDKKVNDKNVQMPNIFNKNIQKDIKKLDKIIKNDAKMVKNSQISEKQSQFLTPRIQKIDKNNKKIHFVNKTIGISNKGERQEKLKKILEINEFQIQQFLNQGQLNKNIMQQNLKDKKENPQKN